MPFEKAGGWNWGWRVLLRLSLGLELVLEKSDVIVVQPVSFELAEAAGFLGHLYEYAKKPVIFLPQPVPGTSRSTFHKVTTHYCVFPKALTPSPGPNATFVWLILSMAQTRIAAPRNWPTERTLLLSSQSRAITVSGNASS